MNQRTVFAAKGFAALLVSLVFALAVFAVPAKQAFASAPLTIDSISQFNAFRVAVNSGEEDYEGKTVKLTSGLRLSLLSSFTPIGTKEHPFLGTFDGAGYKLSGLKASFANGASENIGVFGYIGPGGSVKNLTLENCEFAVESSDKLIRNVGVLAGYAYGAIGNDAYAFDSCKLNSCMLNVTSTMQVDPEKEAQQVSPDGAIESGYTDAGCTIERIGGVVGYCAGSVKATTFSGQVNVTTHETPDGDNPTIANCVGGIAGQLGGYAIDYQNERTATSSFEPVYPTADGAGSMTGTVSRVVSCVNTGAVTTTVDGDGGKDRFGEDVSAKLRSVGGVVGYSMANVESCTNSGKIDSMSGDGVGGIVGSLRAVTFTGTNSASSDPGSFKPEGESRLTGPQLRVFRCGNSGEVVALHAGGGILGGGGTYTHVNQCVNAKGGDVFGIRWNKPTCGGVVGQTFGDVSYSYSRANVSSGLTGSGGGYFIAGVVGAINRYEMSNGEDFDSPVPEVYACYMTGDIYVGGNYRQAGICGESEGFIHDCYFLMDSVSYVQQLENPAIADDYGTCVAATVVGLEGESADVTASDLLKSKIYTGKLNGAACVDDYASDNYFVPAVNSDMNDGYAVLKWQRSANGMAIDESKLNYRGVGLAAYSATNNPMPQLTVTYGSTTLVEGADFYVVPDEAVLGENGKCRSVASAANVLFKSPIVGIGDYYTSKPTTWTAPYTLGKSSFSTCAVYIKQKTFNYLPQYPAAPTDEADSEVIITDAGGNRVPASDFEMEVDPGNLVNYNYIYKSKSLDGFAHVGYPISFTAKKGSNYAGTIVGYFQIGKAALIDSNKAHISSISFNGQSWLYSMGNIVNGGMTDSKVYRIVDGEEVDGMQIPYTGESIKPTIDSFTYKDGNGEERELVRGTAADYDADYRIVYGDPGDASNLISSDARQANTDVTSDEVGKRACMTFRYIASNTSNFYNYQNVFFDIVPADVSKADEVTVTIPDSMAYTGTAPNITLKGATGAVISSDNYTVTAAPQEGSNNSIIEVVVTGKNNLTGTYVKEVINTNAATIPMSKAVVTLDRKVLVFSGAMQTVTPSVQVLGTTLTEGVDYTVSGNSATELGNYVLTITGMGRYEGTKQVNYAVKTADEVAADAVIELITSLGSVSATERENAIESARNAYDALTETQADLVSNEVLSALEGAESELADDRIAAGAVTEQVNGIGEIVSLEQKAAVKAARAAYKGLNANQKALVSTETLEQLTAAEAAIAQLQKEVDDQAAADRVIALVNAIGEVTSTAQGSQIVAARRIYTSLDPDQKALVPSETLDTLAAAEVRLAELQKIEDDEIAVLDAKEWIAAIGEVTSLDQKDIVVAARYAYDGLSDELKEQISDEELAALVAAEETIAKLQREYDEAHKKAQPLKTGSSIVQTLPVGTFTYKVTGQLQVQLLKVSGTKAKRTFTVNTVSKGGFTYKVTSIAANAFKSSKLKAVTVGANVKTIGKGAFAKSAQLSSVVIGSGVTQIGASAFNGCKKLKKLVVASKALTSKKSVSKCLKGSKVKTVKLKSLGGKKKAVKKAFQKYAGKKGVKVK